MQNEKYCKWKDPEYRKEYQKNYREKNKDILKAYQDNYRQENKQILREKSNQYQAEHREEAKERAKEWYWNNRQRSLNASKEYYENNKVAIKEYQHQYQQLNKQKCNQVHNEWRRNNKANNTEIQKRYRQKKAEQKRMYNLLEAKQMFKDIKHVTFKDNEHIWILQNGKVFNTNTMRYQKQGKGTHGYLVSIGKNTYAVHRLIATAFDDRTKEYLDSFDCHHLDISVENNALDNLVFMDGHLHNKMHKHLSRELIIQLGKQVKDLRGSEKTKQFEKLVREQLMNKILDIL